MRKYISFLIFAVAFALCRAAASPLRVACIGDSITYGLGLQNREAESYPARLQALLDDVSPGKYEVRNFGNSGRGVYLDSMRGSERRGFRYMKEHSDALSWRPDVVVCNLGINDCDEYKKELVGKRSRGQFVADYLALLGDYRKANPDVRLAMWTKFSPLGARHRLYRSPEPFLMQDDLEKVARRVGADAIDMLSPLRDEIDVIFAEDGIHPNAAGAEAIAKATLPHVVGAKPCEVALPSGLAGRSCELWLCAGQSNMQKGWDEFRATPLEEKRVARELAQLLDVEVWLWDVNAPDAGWMRLAPDNAGARCALGVSFAIRRAKASKKPVGILYVAAGGAPAESFVSEQVMCKVGADGKPAYPRLCAIATNRHQINANDDFPCVWCKREYKRRKGKAAEAGWWPVSMLYDRGVKRVAHLPIAGVLWYQGESNATKCMAPDAPLDDDYMLETNLAVIEQLRGERRIPFVMMGLPKMNRPWAPYRAAQRKACEMTGALFVDTFAAGLGDPNDVHPRDKIPFAEMAISRIQEGANSNRKKD